MLQNNHNTTYKKREYFSLQEMYGPKVFGPFVRRKAVTSHTFTFIVNHDQAHRESVLKREVENVSRRLFQLSNNSVSYNNSIQVSINPNLKNYLTHQQLTIYNRCLQYIKDNNLPTNFSYNVLDYLAATQNHGVILSEEKILKRIARRYVLNINQVSTPKSRETIYNTLPRAFSPLFFEMIKFAAGVLSDQEVRKDFEEYLIYTFGEQMKTATHDIIQVRNDQQLSSLINQAFDNIENLWRVPKNLLTKFNQTKMFIRNSVINPSPLLEFMSLSYLCHACSYGLDLDPLKELTPAKVIANIEEYVSTTVKHNKKNIKKGWSIFDSIPQRESFLFSKIEELCRKLNVKDSESTIFKLKLRVKNRYSGSLKLKKGIRPGVFNFSVAL